MNRKIYFSISIIILALSASFNVIGENTLTVLDFETDSVSKNEMKVIVEFLTSELFKLDLFTVIDVSQRDMILDELKFSLSGCTDETCALEVGRLLSAERIVIGSMSQIGSRYLLSTKMLEVETSKTLSITNDTYNDIDELIDSLGDVASELMSNSIKSNNEFEVLSWFDVGEIQTRTKDLKPSTVLVNVKLGYEYNNTDKENDLFQRKEFIQDVIRNYFSDKYVNELNPATESIVKTALINKINRIVSVGKIENIVFMQYSIFSY